MLFIGYIQGNEMDLLVSSTAGSVIEYYFTLEELYYDLGEDTEYSIIYLEDVEILLADLSVMRFDDIGMS